jgi:hypothetical protein
MNILSITSVNNFKIVIEFLKIVIEIIIYWKLMKYFMKSKRKNLYKTEKIKDLVVGRIIFSDKSKIIDIINITES